MDQVIYEELFYMIEVGESDYIEDEEYLKNYDLIDILGVSEYNEEKTDEKLLEIKEYKNLEAANAVYVKVNNKHIHFQTVEKKNGKL